MLDGECGKQGNTAYLSNGDLNNGFVAWSGGCGVDPACSVFEATRGVQRWAWRGGPRALCLVVAIARQPVRGPDLVVSLCRTVCDFAAALRRWVPHGSGLLGEVWSSSHTSLPAQGRALDDDYMSRRCSVAAAAKSRFFSPFVQWSVSDRVDASIQPVGSCLFFLLFFSFPGYDLTEL